MVQLVEARDDVEVDPIAAPEVFSRNYEDFATFKDTGLTYAELPRPTTWHVLILPKQPKKMSKGGIVIPAQAQTIESMLNYIGEVVALGPMCGQHDRFMVDAPDQETPASIAGLYNVRSGARRSTWNIKVGDWVIYGRFASMQKIYKDYRFLTVNDDEITDVIDSPANYRVE